MDNLEKDKVSKIFSTVWDMTKRYAFIKLDDFLWERFVEEMEQNSQEIKKQDHALWMLYRGMVDSVRNYKEIKEKECKNGPSSMGTMED